MNCLAILNIVYLDHIAMIIDFLCQIMTLIKCCRIMMLHEGFGAL